MPDIGTILVIVLVILLSIYLPLFSMYAAI